MAGAHLPNIGRKRGSARRCARRRARRGSAARRSSGSRPRLRLGLSSLTRLRRRSRLGSRRFDAWRRRGLGPRDLDRLRGLRRGRRRRKLDRSGRGRRCLRRRRRLLLDRRRRLLRAELAVADGGVATAEAFPAWAAEVGSTGGGGGCSATGGVTGVGGGGSVGAGAAS